MVSFIAGIFLSLLCILQIGHQQGVKIKPGQWPKSGVGIAIIAASTDIKWHKTLVEDTMRDLIRDQVIPQSFNIRYII